MAKGGAIKEDASCGAFNDTSKSHTGTLLLGKVWTFDLRISTGAEQ